METKMRIAFAQLRAMSLPEMQLLLRDWWLEGFLDLCPERLTRWFSRPRKPVLLFAHNEERVSLELFSGEGAFIGSERVEINADVPEMIERLLGVHQIAPREADIGLQLPEHYFFNRELQLPIEAAREMETIAVQDLVRKTPFKLREIYCDHVATTIGGKGKILVQQSIVRRQCVDDTLRSFDFDIENLAFITCGTNRADYRRPTIKLKKADVTDLWFRKLTFALCCSAIALLIVAGGLKYWWQQQEMDRLSIETVTANKKAQQVRTLVDQLQEKKGLLVHLRLQRSELPGAIDLWDEMSRILPAHTWLTEFRLSETPGHEMQVAISGFSGAAPSLVGIVSGSRMFSDAALTSPVAFDSAEGRERFSLQAKVKVPEMLKEAAR